MNVLRSVVKQAAVVLLTSHGFSSSIAHETEPATLARTTCHVLVAWIGLTIERLRAGRVARAASALLARLRGGVAPASPGPSPRPNRTPSAT